MCYIVQTCNFGQIVILHDSALWNKEILGGVWMISFYQYIYTSRDVNGEVNGWKMNDAHTGNMQLRNFQCIKDALSLWNDDDGNLMNGKKHRKTL